MDQREKEETKKEEKRIRQEEEEKEERRIAKEEERIYAEEKKIREQFREQEKQFREEEEQERIQKEKEVNTWVTIEEGQARYKGEWKNGLPNGKGIKHFYKTDSYIDGNFVDGFAEGYCKQTYEKTWEKSVPYYEGEFKRNNYNGKGEYHYGDGDYYKGMWKDGKYHGQGAAYNTRLDRTWVGEYCNDEKIEGNWVNGEI
jgi:hypothetical protein